MCLTVSNSGLTSLTNLFVPKETNWFVAKNSKIDYLQWFDKSSKNLHQIEHINLANSSINSIEPNFFSKIVTFGKVRYLNLAHNKLKGFNRDIQKNWETEMYLSGNPTVCNCGMLWFAEWLNATVYHNKSVRDYKDIRCVGGEWDGKQVYKLTKEQMGCFPTVKEL